MSPLDATRVSLESIAPRHFRWSVDGAVATITLDRPERKNPLTFEAYAELIETFRRVSRSSRRSCGCAKRMTPKASCRSRG
jgi:hypothetical protein